MNFSDLDNKITDRGKEFFASISGEAPSIFNKGWWTGKVMDWSMQNENFKIQLFRFVDVLPYLNSSESLSRHIDEYFAGDDQDVPKVLKWGAGAMGSGLGGKLAAGIMAKTIRSNIEGMAKQFIIGENTGDAIKNLKKIRKDGFAFTVDILGEATVSEIESDAYLTEYMELLGALSTEFAKWPALGGRDLDWGTPLGSTSPSNPPPFFPGLTKGFRRFSPGHPEPTGNDPAQGQGNERVHAYRHGAVQVQGDHPGSVPPAAGKR